MSSDDEQESGTDQVNSGFDGLSEVISKIVNQKTSGSAPVLEKRKKTNVQDSDDDVDVVDVLALATMMEKYNENPGAGAQGETPIL